MLMSPWVYIFGDSEWALRFPSAVFGTGAVAISYFVGLNFFRHALGGRIFAFAVAVNPSAIYFSQEARSYSLLLLLTLLLLFFRSRWLAKPEDFRKLLLYAIFATLMVHTHHIAWLFLAGLWLGDLWNFRGSGIAHDAIRKKLFLSYAGIGLITLPSLLAFLLKYEGNSFHWVAERGLNLGDLLRMQFSLTSIVPRVNPGWTIIEIALLLASVYGAILIFRDTVESGKSEALGILLATFCPPLIAQIAAWLNFNFMMDRYFIYTMPGLWISTIVGVQRIPSFPVIRKFVLISFLAFGPLHLFALERYYSRIIKEQWRQTIGLIASDHSEKDAHLVLCSWNNKYFRYYLERHEFRYRILAETCYLENLEHLPTETQELIYLYGHREARVSNSLKDWEVADSRSFNRVGFLRLERKKTAHNQE